jgi:integral membrane protein
LLMRPEMPQNLASAYFAGWRMNFIAALPLQLLIVGPVSRLKLQMLQRYFDSRI